MTLLFTLCTCCSVTQSWQTLCNPMDCSMLGFPVLHHLPEFAQTHVYWVNDTIQPYHPLSLPSPPAFNLSQYQGLFQWVDSIKWPKVLKLQLQHQSFQYIFRSDFLFRIDWFDLLAVQGTVKSLHHHSYKASVLWCSAFFMVQVSNPYMTTGKTIALTTGPVVSDVMSLLYIFSWGKYKGLEI